MTRSRKSTEESLIGAAPQPRSFTPRGRRILDGLEDIFLREGFRRVTIGELAGRLHCSRHTLYQLAQSKEELVLVVLARVLGRIRQIGLEAARARGDVRERIVTLVEPGVSELRHATSLFFADVAAFAPAKRMLEQHQNARREDVQRLLDEAIRARTFRNINSRLAAEVIVAAVQRVMDSSFLVEVGLSAADAIRGAEDLLLHGLLHLAERGDRATPPTPRRRTAATPSPSPSKATSRKPRVRK